MKKLLIVQSIEGQADSLKELVAKHFPEVFGEIIATDSFDHGLTLVSKDNDLIIISSWMFHDKHSTHSDIPETVPDKEKDGDMLAKMVKEKNPSAKVYIYSEYSPKSDYVHGYIEKKRGNTDAILEFIKKLV